MAADCCKFVSGEIVDNRSIGPSDSQENNSSDAQTQYHSGAPAAFNIIQ